MHLEMGESIVKGVSRARTGEIGVYPKTGVAFRAGQKSKRDFYDAQVW
jgi:hypothetical protein